MKIIGLIPARMASSRFPGKPLALIKGLPLIIHVMKRSMLCPDLDEVFVVTDSPEIYDVVCRHNGQAIMTSKRHETGTDRIAEAIEKIDCDIAVNIQGDEVLVYPEHISSVIRPLIADPCLPASILICQTDHLNDATDCKATLDLAGNILYMSRADIPSTLRARHTNLYKLYCVVAFRRDFLIEFAKWEQTPLEKIEYIEYLRILEKGHRIRGLLVDFSPCSVDIPLDIGVASDLIATDSLWRKYQEVKG
ncbi:3-deoxy-manno-octulosonate cytidylyltransferase [bacterium]|nr:3-deoxy-manno-octulosonate cytidylyltransferase [bacterium]